MESYYICPFQSSLIYLAWCFQSSPRGSMYQKNISFQDNNILFPLLSTTAISNNTNCAKGKSFEESDSMWGVSRCGGSGRKRNSETEETVWHRGPRPERDWPVFDTEKRTVWLSTEREKELGSRWGAGLGKGQFRQGHVCYCSVFAFSVHKGNALKYFKS